MSEGEAVANAAARAAESHAKSECCGESRRVTCEERMLRQEPQITHMRFSLRHCKPQFI